MKTIEYDIRSDQEMATFRANGHVWCVDGPVVTVTHDTPRCIQTGNMYTYGSFWDAIDAAASMARREAGPGATIRRRGMSEIVDHQPVGGA